MPKFNRVLLVDDDRAMNYLSADTIKKLNIANEIEVAQDGTEACEKVQGKACPEIIFLDIKMPRMDGFDFLEHLEKHNMCRKSKVVMLTSSIRPEDQEKAFTFKAVVDYFEKPLTADQVTRMLNTHFANK